MKAEDGTYGIWDYIRKDTDFISKKTQDMAKEAELEKKYKFFANIFANSNKEEDKKENWVNQRRLTGRLKFKSKTGSGGHGHKADHNNHSKNTPHFEEEDIVTCTNHFKEYCATTSLHGYRYISEPKRTYTER